MTFGKNRVQYNQFRWSYFRYERFDVYFYQEGRDVAQYVAKIAESKLSEAEDLFYNPVDQRLIFVVYSRLTDFRQSNIGLVGASDEYNIGGTTVIIDNKISIYNEGDLNKLENQVAGAVAQVVIRNLLSGTSLSDKLTGDTGVELPEWFQTGLERYTAKDWSLQADADFKSGFIVGRYRKLITLRNEDAAIAGHAFWSFIAKTYGKGTISDILYLTRVNRDYNASIYQVLGISVKKLMKEWEAFYCNRYQDDSSRVAPEGTLVVKKPRVGVVVSQVKISPNGKQLSYVTNEMSKQTIWLYSLDRKKRKKVISFGHKLEQIPDLSTPVMAWHPNSELLTFIVEEKGWMYLYYFNVATREMSKRMLPEFRKVLSYSFSPDAKRLVLSAVRDGKNDLFLFSMASGNVERITNDPYSDIDPRFVKKGTAIMFSSDRSSDTLLVKDIVDFVPRKSKDLFVVDYPLTSNPPIAQRLDDYTPSLKRGAVELLGDRTVFLSDQNGIANRYVARSDSAINFIDTSIHYRHFLFSKPQTNYKGWITTADYNPTASMFAEVVQADGRSRTYFGKSDFAGEINGTSKLKPTVYAAELQRRDYLADSIAAVTPKTVIISAVFADSVKRANTLTDSSFVDVNGYVFEEEKLNAYFAKQYGDYFYIQKDGDEAVERKKARVYETNFYPHYLVNQIDFGFLNSSYQAFTGGAVYFNPGMNVLFKVGTRDLFEDYRLVGGVKFSSDFASNEYLLSFENLKKRVDKQIVFHRQAFKNETGDFIEKIHSHEVLLSLKYPFTQVSAIKGTFIVRHDRQVILSTDIQTLGAVNSNKLWTGVKFEYIFDNTIRRGVNIFYGTRYKAFSESYLQINGNTDDLHVLGFDFRHYAKIHRDLIFATRFATSTSFGSARLVYYLGSVDNWINLNSTVPTFNSNIPIKQRANYAFQTLATNMRGFSQNIRNGNSFAVLNNEVRWPFVRYFANHSFSSGFWDNLQVCLFGDVGTAWTGLTPYSGENSYDKRIYYNGPITVEVETNIEPIVYGYGFGVRSKVLGYFMRFDWAWGVDSGVRQPRIFYFSLSTDF
ncbi:TolB-like translocation protein [Williamwhitmania taraxaci]|nr:PD40 domain-containing protein [Williamwhitmania taraxaci]